MRDVRLLASIASTAALLVGCAGKTGGQSPSGTAGAGGTQRPVVTLSCHSA
jgi:hypothetical protein